MIKPCVNPHINLLDKEIFNKSICFIYGVIKMSTFVVYLRQAHIPTLNWIPELIDGTVKYIYSLLTDKKIKKKGTSL